MKKFVIIQCKECKYAVRDQDGKLPTDYHEGRDLVCSYWNTDGLDPDDFCSHGEEGVYKLCQEKRPIRIIYGLTFKQEYWYRCPHCNEFIDPPSLQKDYYGPDEDNFFYICDKCKGRIYI